MARRHLAFSAIVLVLLGSTVAYTSQAGANFASQATGDCYWSYIRECYADSYVHTWSSQVGPRTHAAIEWSLYNSYDTTDLDIPDNEESHSGSVDIWYHFADVAGGVGVSSCQTWTGHVCAHWHVLFDDGDIGNYSNVALISLACHETGHTVGLMHQSPAVFDDGNPTNSDDENYRCMVTDSNPQNNSQYVGTHNVGHINGYYSP